MDQKPTGAAIQPLIYQPVPPTLPYPHSRRVASPRAQCSKLLIPVAKINTMRRHLVAKRAKLVSLYFLVEVVNRRHVRELYSQSSISAQPLFSCLILRHSTLTLFRGPAFFALFTHFVVFGILLVVQNSVNFIYLFLVDRGHFRAIALMQGVHPGLRCLQH